MILLFAFAFLAGLVTPLAPCIWPILPILFSTSAFGKGHLKPLGVTVGLMMSFGLLTLVLSTLVQLFHLDSNVLRLIAVIVIAFLGILLIFPSFSAWVEAAVSRLNGFLPSSAKQGNGFIPGFISGLILGIVWSPCAGPILAAVATLSATGKVNLEVILVTGAYVLGLGIPLLVFTYGGRVVVTKTRFISAYTGRVQQIFGVIMLLTALAIYTNYDTYLEAQMLNAFPGLSGALNQFESSKTVSSELSQLRGVQQQINDSTSGLFNTDVAAPDFVGITHWLNLPGNGQSLSLKDLKGKVVLVDFWTYTCINCIRTLPHVTSWYDTYNKYGFVVVGIHTPEFQFEHDTNNVAQAIRQFGIHYPVGQDNNYATWNAYSNEYWPAEYLIDAKGFIRRTDFGEGQYDQMEEAIRQLLIQNGASISSQMTSVPDQTPTEQTSPETYLGTARMEYYYPSGSVSNGVQSFTLTSPSVNSFSLGGSWDVESDAASPSAGATLVYHFNANKVFLVMKPTVPGQSFPVSVLLDGQTVSSATAGADVHNGTVTVDTDRLYSLVDLHGKAGDHTLELTFPQRGLQLFAFTFG